MDMLQRADDQPAATPAHPLGELLALAGPTVLQMASYTLMQFIDTWILSRTGNVTALTAAATAGMFAFSVISLGIGIMFVVNTLVSQAFGRGDFRDCGRYLWQGIWVSIGFSLLLWPLIRHSSALFSWMHHEPELARLEGVYLKIVLSAAVLKLTATATEQFILGVNHPAVVAVATASGVGVNAVAAWALVLGRLGFAPRGVAGSAMAQNVGVGVELLVCAAVAAVVGRGFNPFDWIPRWRYTWALLKMGIPSGVQIVSEVLAWTAFTTWVMARFGTEVMAANVLVFRYMSVSFMPAFGISVAVTALVGRYIGAGRPDIAVARTRLGFAVTVVYMIACGLLMFLFRGVLIGTFTQDPKVLSVGKTLLIFAAVYQLFDATYIVYNGGLRGMGDTLVPAMATGILCWSLTVGAAFWIAERFPQWGAAGPWCAASVYGMVIGLFIVLQFERQKKRALSQAVSAKD